MGTNNKKLKRQKAARNNGHHSRVVQAAREKQAEIEDRLSLNPARPEELDSLQEQFGRKK